jgi:hypothetical protein
MTDARSAGRRFGTSRRAGQRWFVVTGVTSFVLRQEQDNPRLVFFKSCEVREIEPSDRERDKACNEREDYPLNRVHAERYSGLLPVLPVIQVQSTTRENTP